MQSSFGPQPESPNYNEASAPTEAAGPEPLLPPLSVELSSPGFAEQGLSESPFSEQQTSPYQISPSPSAPAEPPLSAVEGVPPYGYPYGGAPPQGSTPQHYPPHNSQFVPQSGYASSPLPYPGAQPPPGYPQSGYPPPYGYGQGDAPYPPQSDATSGLIPYKNPLALTSYYLAVFALIPCLGLMLAPIAFVLGLLGLKHARANPQAKGTVHAWIGIIGGGLITLCYFGLFLSSFLAVRH